MKSNIIKVIPVSTLIFCGCKKDTEIPNYLIGTWELRSFKLPSVPQEYFFTSGNNNTLEFGTNHNLIITDTVLGTTKRKYRIEKRVAWDGIVRDFMFYDNGPVCKILDIKGTYPKNAT